MEKTYQEWIYEVDLAYHVLGLRHALVMKCLQRRTEEPLGSTYPLPKAKKTCTERKITGQVRASPDSPIKVLDAKKTCHK